ncbi:MAG: 50S ribosomal protein L22 [Planctomycetota bacterium]|nr:50S ribosomal protein L22 [Planctomycetota bacterium]
MEYIAQHRHAPMSAQKVRRVANMIRGKNVNEALNILRYQPQRASRLLRKVLQSAQANAEFSGVDDVDRLFVSKVYVDEGVRMKRWRPGPRGHVSPLLKRRCHISVILEEKAPAD